MTEPTSDREPISEAEAVKAAKLKVKLDQSLGRKTEPWIVDLSLKSPTGHGATVLKRTVSWVGGAGIEGLNIDVIDPHDRADSPRGMMYE